MSATGAGYNPYRKANGEFASKDEIGDVEAKVEQDLDTARLDGDTETVDAIEEYAIDNMPESTVGKKLLEERYGVVGTASKQQEPALQYSNDLPATEDNAQKLMKEYELNSTVEYAEAWEEDGVLNLEFGVENEEFMAQVDGNTLGDVRKAMIDSLEDYDLDSETRELVDTSDDVEFLYQKQEELYDTANSLRTEVGRQEQSYETLDQMVENDFEGGYSQTNSPMKNYDPVTEENIDELIEDYELDHSNSDVHEVDGEITIVVEGPNHTTMSLYHNRAEDGETIGDLRETMMRGMNDFSGDEEFDDLWSNEFGDHNNFTATDFYVTVNSDQKYFESRANDIRDDYNENNS